jgi:hypothetical protein
MLGWSRGASMKRHQGVIRMFMELLLLPGLLHSCTTSSTPPTETGEIGDDGSSSSPKDFYVSSLSNNPMTSRIAPTGKAKGLASKLARQLEGSKKGDGLSSSEIRQRYRGLLAAQRLGEVPFEAMQRTAIQMAMALEKRAATGNAPDRNIGDESWLDSFWMKQLLPKIARSRRVL